MNMAIKALIFDYGRTLGTTRAGPYPGVVRMLASLSSQYRLGLITVGGEGVALRRAHLEATGILPFFSHVDVVEEKTAGQYERAIAALDASPAETVIVDDLLHRGIAIGKRLGCVTVWIGDGDSPGPDFTIRRVTELPGILSGL